VITKEQIDISHLEPHLILIEGVVRKGDPRKNTWNIQCTCGCGNGMKLGEDTIISIGKILEQRKQKGTKSESNLS
jgi:hypothetical protein